MFYFSFVSFVRPLLDVFHELQLDVRDFAQVVVNALIQAIPAIFNVLLVCLVFWLIFSIMGVNLFGGRFSSCVDEFGETVSFNVVSSKNDCDILGPLYNYTWFTPKVNFDNCLIAYLALFQVVSESTLFTYSTKQFCLLR